MIISYQQRTIMMDNETKKLLGLVDSMGQQNTSLFEAIMMLDAAPQGKRLRMIKNVNMHISERKLDERRKEEVKSEKGSKKGKARSKQQKADPGIGKSCELPFNEI